VSKIAIVAGEASGDLIASQLMQDLKRYNKNISFIGVGGPKMERQGLNSFFEFSILSIMGVVDVIKNIRTLLRARKKLITYLLEEKPSIFIGIDAPDFNLYVEKKLKANGVRVFHLVSPSVWAWRKNRIHYIKKVMHHLFCVFPHEPEIYGDINHSASFVGHSLAAKIPLNPNVKNSRKLLKIQSKRKIIGLMPGSRQHEVRYLLDVMLEAAKLINMKIDCEFLISASNTLNSEKIKTALKTYQIKNIKLIIGRSHDLINASDILICASGTTTLEAALFKKPMVVTYKATWIEFQLYKLLRLTKFISLPNILLNKDIVPEILQDKLSPQILADKSLEIIQDDEYRTKIKNEFTILHRSLRRDTSRLIYKELKPFLK